MWKPGAGPAPRSRDGCTRSPGFYRYAVEEELLGGPPFTSSNPNLVSASGRSTHQSAARCRAPRRRAHISSAALCLTQELATNVFGDSVAPRRSGECGRRGAPLVFIRAVADQRRPLSPVANTADSGQDGSVTQLFPAGVMAPPPTAPTAGATTMVSTTPRESVDRQGRYDDGVGESIQASPGAGPPSRAGSPPAPWRSLCSPPET
jgi:hypothetical protein